MIDNVRSIGDEAVNIAIVGKYIKLEDSYLSVIESLHHAGFANKVKVNIKLIDCDAFVVKKNVVNNEVVQKSSGSVIGK